MACHWVKKSSSILMTCQTRQVGVETPFIHRNCTTLCAACADIQTEYTLHSSSEPVSVSMALCRVSPRSDRGSSRYGPILEGPGWPPGTGLDTGLDGGVGDEAPRSPGESPASAPSLAHLAGGWSSESSRLCAALRRHGGAGLLHCKFILTGRFSTKTEKNPSL